MRLIFFFVVVSSLSAINYCLSQSHDFRKGFIVNFTNDTTYGFLDYGNPASNAQFIAFRKDSIGNTSKLFPQDIKAYTFFNSKYYVSKKVIFEGIEKNVFLEYLVDGIVDLYFIRVNDSDRKDVYFIEKNGILYELNNDEKTIYQNDKVYKTENQKYKGIIKYVMKDAYPLSDKIKNIEFSHKSLIKITKDYHEIVCDTLKCIVYSKKEKRSNDVKWKVNYGISIAYMNSQLNMNSDVTNNLIVNQSPAGQNNNYFILDATKSDFASQIGSFFPALFVNFNRNQRTSFQLELRYQNVKYQQIQFEDLSIPFLVNYEFMYYKNPKPYINIGVVTDINLNNNLNGLSIKYAKYENADYISHEDLIPKNVFNSIRFKVSAGAGVKYNLTPKNGVKLELRYELTPFSNNFYNLNGGANINSSLKFSNILFLISYFFK